MFSSARATRSISLTTSLPLALTLVCGACGSKEVGSEGTQTDPGTTGSGSSGTSTSAAPTSGSTSAASEAGSTGGGSTTTAASTGEPATTDGDCVTGFLCTPDGGGGEAVGCDVFAQDCHDGEKCVAYGTGGSSWNATKCVPVMGEGVPGDVCSAPQGGLTGIDDCGAGAFCWDVLNNLGVCVALCEGTANSPMCDAESVCLISNEGVLNLCLPKCDPLVQDCPGDDLCVPNGANFFCSQDASGDEGQANDPCQGGNVCDKGLLCRDTATASSACDPNSTGCCQPYCEYPGGSCPNPDQECLQWYSPDDLPANDPALDIGVCGIP